MVAEKKKKISLRQWHKRKRETLEANPRNCDHCGRPITEKDNLTVPVCRRKACQDWWKTERVIRKKELMAAYRAEHRYKDRYPKHVEKPEPLPSDYDPKNDFSQKKYEQEQAELSKPNGWKCRLCGKALTGNYRFHCADCGSKVRQTHCRLDGDFLYDDASGCASGYDWGVATV